MIIPAQQPYGAFGRAGSDLLHKVTILMLVAIPLMAVALAIWQVWERYVSIGDLALLLALYVPISLGVTAGFHRMLTHRSFRAHPFVRGAILILGSMAVEGSAIDWAANHLKHHALADKPGDPHSPLDGLAHAHLGWLFHRDQADPRMYCRFLLNDPVVKFVDRTFVLWVALSLVIPFVAGGWSGLVWGGLVRIFLVHHVTWSVNSVCHSFGSRPFETTDQSRNQWLVGLLAMGEGWHNNHHAFPRSAVHGLGRWQFDGSAWLITALEFVGLARDVQRIAPDGLQRRYRSGGQLRSWPSSWRRTPALPRRTDRQLGRRPFGSSPRCPAWTARLYRRAWAGLFG